MLVTQIQSLKKLDKTKRYQMILEELKKYDDGLTARELAYKLGFIERNAVAPRLTELESKGKVIITGIRHDDLTARSVAVYSIKEER